MDVCVVGAGVIGLSTAVALQERMPSPTGCRVTIVRDRSHRHTDSYGSGGQVVPFAPAGIPTHIGKQWAKDSSDHFFGLAFSAQAGEAGVSLVSGFQLTDNDEKPIYLDSVINVKKMDLEDVRRFGRSFKHGYIATCPLVELPVYMDWLMAKFLSKGGKVVQRHIDSFEELSGDYDVIVNCTGMGSRKLANDPLLRPMRGQVLHLKAPWVKNFVRVDATMHVFPFRDSVFVGSVKQLDNENMALSPDDSEFILKRAQEVFPPLKGARVMYEWVGMRPQRNPMRVEAETVMTKEGKPLKIVHNYGHGSFGISLSWGVGVYAAKIVEDILKEQNPRSKL